MGTTRSSSRLPGGGSASVHAGIPPLGVGLETTPGCWPGGPPGCGPGDLQGMLGDPPGDLQGMLGYHPPVNRILDTRFWKNYLAPTSLRAVTMIWSPGWCNVYAFLSPNPAMQNCLVRAIIVDNKVKYGSTRILFATLDLVDIRCLVTCKSYLIDFCF